MNLLIEIFIMFLFTFLFVFLIFSIVLPFLLYFREKFYFNPIYYYFDCNEFIQKYSVKQYKYKDCNYWFIPSRNGSKKIIFYLHGNAGNITFRTNMLIKLIEKLDCNIVIIDYLCQGKSLTSELLIKTGIEIIKYLDLKDNDTILYGESIGCAIALEIAKRIKFKNVICMVGFSSMREMIRHIFRKIGIFLGFFVKELDNLRILRDIGGNVLILNSRDDEVIPFNQAEKLQKIIGVDFMEIEGKHNEPKISEKIFNYIKQKYEI